ncbi:MAG: M15 family metallopeptidase, partial [Actinobacteria bacterium]|nr:M15 family metallopeptidase [Actinomycetota bacterium]
VLCLAAVACGGPADAPRGGNLVSEASAEGGITLPQPLDATPAYLLAPETDADPKDLARLERVPGVEIVVSASLRRVTVEGPGGAQTLRVAAIDPLEYRSVAPESSSEAEFVWTSLLGGEAVLTFEAAERLGIDGGGTITIEGAGDIEVGAFADNQTPNIADVVVDRSVGHQMSSTADPLLTVGVAPGTPLDALGAELKEVLPGARLVPLIPPELTSNPDPSVGDGSAGGGVIGRMNFKVLDDGFIRPDPDWVTSNIATSTVPIVGEVSCHRLMIPQLHAALSEIEAKDLAPLIRSDDYGGCYVPRFIDRNPELPLSMHAFGLAIDLNVSTNQLGTGGDLDPRIVRIFERWGFTWGGAWTRPDPMHFELARLVETG